MGPINVMPTVPTVSGAFGEGMNRGMNAGLSAQLQDMLEQKQIHRSIEIDQAKRQQFAHGVTGLMSNLTPERKRLAQSVFSEIGPEQSMKLLENYSPDELVDMIAGSTNGQAGGQAGGQSDPYAAYPLGPQREIYAPENELLPYEAREAIEEPTEEQAVETPPRLPIQPTAAKAPVRSLSAAKLADMDDRQFEEETKKTPMKIRKQLADMRDKEINTRLKGRSVDIKEEQAKHEFEKDPREYSNSLDDAHRLNNNRKIILSTMEEQAKKLPKGTPIKKFLSDRLGLPISVISGPETEMIDKLAAQLIQGVSVSYDQARILQTEVEQYIRANPSLLNSPEGIEKIAKIGQVFLNIDDKAWKYKNKIVQQYRSAGEHLPEDLKNKVVIESDKYVDEAKDEIRKIMGQGNEFPEKTKQKTITDLSKLAIGTKVRKSGDPNSKILTWNGKELVE